MLTQLVRTEITLYMDWKNILKVCETDATLTVTKTSSEYHTTWRKVMTNRTLLRTDVLRK